MKRKKPVIKVPLEQRMLLTREEAAEYCRISLSTVVAYRHGAWKDFIVAQGATGRRIFFSRKKIDEWLENGGMAQEEEWGA